MATYRTIMSKANYLLFLAVLFCLPFPQIGLRYLIVTWGVSWLLEGRWLSRPEQCQDIGNGWSRRWPSSLWVPCVLFALWFVWECVSMLWAPDKALAKAQIERHLAIPMLLPITIWGVNNLYDYRRIRQVIVYGALAAVPVYFFTMFWVFNHTCVEHPNDCLPTHMFPMAFFANGISAIKHRLFLSSAEILGIIAACYRRKELSRAYGSVEGWLITIMEVAAMCSLVLATGSRASLFAGVALAGVATVEHTPKKYKSLAISGALILAVLMSICVVKLHPRMQSFEWEHLRLEKMDASRNARLNIWSMALDEPKDYLWQGLGAGQSPQYLQQRYAEHGYTSYVQQGHHAHNQYLMELLELGVFGLALFVLACASPVIFARNRQKQTAAYMLTLYGMNMLTDNMFGKFDGIAIWCVWMMLIMLQADAQGKQQAARDA